MTFYTDLRDDVAGRLITQYGQSATLRQDTGGTYDPTTGVNTASNTDTAIKVVKLPRRGPASNMTQNYSDETVVKSEFGLLISAEETAVAGVTPAVNDLIILGSDTLRIDVISAIDPGGTAVIYKAGASRA